jgi:hypothetical protein
MPVTGKTTHVALQGLDFADAHIVGYEMLDGNLSISIRMWNDTSTKLVFGGVVAFSDVSASEIQHITVRSEDSFFPYIDALYADSKLRQGCVLFCFVDAMERTVLKVIARGVDAKSNLPRD